MTCGYLNPVIIFLISIEHVYMLYVRINLSLYLQDGTVGAIGDYFLL